MAVSLTRFSWWLWNGNKEKETVSGGSSLCSSVEWLREPDSVTFLAKNLATEPSKVKRKCQQSKMDKQLLPSDAGGAYLSSSESGVPDWSIGWVEPHGPEFQIDDETEDGFAVLVPCYRSDCNGLVKGSATRLLTAMKNLPSGFSSEGEWLSSMPNF